MDLDLITVQDFKTYFRRDFPYLPDNVPAGCDNLDFVQDSDIQKAFGEAKILFNQGLFGSDADIRIGYLYLTAHYLAYDLRTAQAGIQSGGSFPVTSRSVGSVSESYDIPDSYRNIPQYSFLSQTGYGQKYLSLIFANLVGNVVSVAGWTHP